jgi:predicted PurR-regulated permease PerM
LKEEETLREFVSGLSPLNKTHEKTLIKQFSDITKTLIYGQFVIGLVQGIFAGIGFFVFKVPNALVLTVAAIVFSLIPVIGPSPVYIPVAIIMLLSGNPVIAIIFLIYNILVVSTVDNILRINLISRKTKMSQVIVLIGMIGGLFIFGVLGLILGPLILAYFITFLEAYKNRTLASLFST